MLLMTIKQEAAIFGTVVAAIVCGLIVWQLKRLAAAWDNGWFLALCGLIVLCMAALAWWLDKRSAAQAKNARSDLS